MGVHTHQRLGFPRGRVVILHARAGWQGVVYRYVLGFPLLFECLNREYGRPNDLLQQMLARYNNVFVPAPLAVYPISDSESVHPRAE